MTPQSKSTPTEAETKARRKAEVKIIEVRHKAEAKIEAKSKAESYIKFKELQDSISALCNRLCYEKLAPISYLNIVAAKPAHRIGECRRGIRRSTASNPTLANLAYCDVPHCPPVA
ncbi:hypothetical protein QJS10_CPB15g00652 [Acorus calamus]|uniref:Uncharacterized protein n=1 Tax=Acorus calamus TaxID=4465 RepID=A0AAV9D9H3_ACOCL|nr:hypothetical protein QJS10_CPB15g00652 [Acorus calamus]